MKALFFLLVVFAGCVSVPGDSEMLTGYATATWDANVTSNYIMVFYKDTNAGICLDDYPDYNSFYADANALRWAHIGDRRVSLTLGDPSACGEWGRVLYTREVVSFEVV